MKENEGGIILLKNIESGEVLVTDIYQENNHRECWDEWMRTAIMRFNENPQRNKGISIEDYYIGKTENWEKRSDKQIAFLLQNLQPEKGVNVVKAAFALNKGIEMSDLNGIEGVTKEYQEEYNLFLDNSENDSVNIMTGLEKDFGKRLVSGTSSHCERVFRLKGYFSFVGKEQLRNAEDVAWIFRELENKAQEHAFFVMTKGEKSIVLEAGIGNIDRCVVDVAAAIKANSRFQPEKIYFVHNHPSGNLSMSRADAALWSELQELFNGKLQAGIIINTKSGQYGVFDSYGYDKEDFHNHEGKMNEIPVFSFDKVVFDKDYKVNEWKIRSHEDVAAFISSQRLGEREKIAILIADNNGVIRGNFHLPTNQLEESNLLNIADLITDIGISCNATRVFLYAKDGNRKLMRLADKLDGWLHKQSFGILTLNDVITVKKGTVLSANNEGWLNPYRRQEKEKEVFDKIDIIPTAGGNGMIRVRCEGVYLPAEKLRKKEFDGLKNGTLTKEELADIYFKDELNGENKGYKLKK